MNTQELLDIMQRHNIQGEADKDGDIHFTHEDISMTLLPQVRFTYKTGRYFKLYSAVGLGVTYGTFRDKRIVSPCLHFVPFGLTAGRKVYGFAEMGVGMLITGYNVGVGVRF